MKKIVLFSTAVLLLIANAAMAGSIAGKVGVTARGGASYVFGSEFTDEYLAIDTSGTNRDMKRGVGWDVGGGIMYGITDNLSVNFDVIYYSADIKFSDYTVTDRTFGKGKTFDFSLGGQWRFMPKNKFVPYVGAGFDILLNKIDLDADQFTANKSADVDTTYGGHLSVGADYFFTPNIALNAEIRGLYSTKGDMRYNEAGTALDGFVIAKYNPSTISGIVGIRFFFGRAKEASQPIAKEIPPEPLPPPAPAATPPTPPPPVEEMKKEAEASATVEQKIIEKGRATLNVEFDTGKAIVKPAYYKEIENVADVMKKYSALKIVVEGHTDNVGGEKYNLKLSQKRAEAIKEVMVKKFKIESTRIRPKGFGYSKPIADNSTRAGRKSNRRVEASVEYTINK